MGNAKTVYSRHPKFGRVAWYQGKWWRVVGGSVESPSLLVCDPQPPPYRPGRKSSSKGGGNS